MAELTTIRAEARDRAGKGAARATRRDGRVPGVLYGDKKPPVLISIDPSELDREVNKPGFFACCRATCSSTPGATGRCTWISCAWARARA